MSIILVRRSIKSSKFFDKKEFKIDLKIIQIFVLLRKSGEQFKILKSKAYFFHMEEKKIIISHFQTYLNDLKQSFELIR